MKDGEGIITRSPTCGEQHGRVCAELALLKEDKEDQWKIINQMRNYLLVTMGGVLLTLMTLIGNLIMARP